ncbi:hypothetical protein Hanom_Chr09g00778331 [Helianthus anomalus]
MLVTIHTLVNPRFPPFCRKPRPQLHGQQNVYIDNFILKDSKKIKLINLDTKWMNCMFLT